MLYKLSKGVNKLANKKDINENINESDKVFRKVVLSWEITTYGKLKQEVIKMILYYKTKILISGIFPMVNFKIDGFIEKTGQYNEKIIDINNDDYIFYSSGHLLKSMYACKEKKGNYYEYFENEEMVKYEIDNGLSKNEIEQKILSEQFEKVALLQKKIRLLTGFGITLPVFKTSIYDDKSKFYSYVGGVNWDISRIAVSDYDDKMKNKLEQRLHLYIADSTIHEA